MFIELLISLFGFMFIYRILSLLAKTELISSSKLNFYFCFLLVPLYFHLFFKELFIFTLTYIGIFLIILMLFDKIITFLYKKTFEKLYLQLLDRLILHIKAGSSAQTSIKMIFSDLNRREKVTFVKMNDIFEIKISGEAPKAYQNDLNNSYFEELKIILKSQAHITEQLISFRSALRLEHRLRHKSRQALQSTRAQALTSCFIYLAFILLSTEYLNLKIMSKTMFLSLFLFLIGQMIIFFIGRGLKWKT